LQIPLPQGVLRENKKRPNPRAGWAEKQKLGWRFSFRNSPSPEKVQVSNDAGFYELRFAVFAYSCLKTQRS